MSQKPLLHELLDFPEAIRVISDAEGIAPQLVEKDYWLMHCLWALQEQGFVFELKGGTSLSKGWNIIERFSEDVDLKIFPPDDMDVPTGKNHIKQKHREKRGNYFEWLKDSIRLSGITSVERDATFEDRHIRNCGLRLKYHSQFDAVGALKDGILLEVGFDLTTPNEPREISSWAFDFATRQSLEVIDNRAKAVPCYLPEYTFVEKLCAISNKHRQERDGKQVVNFTRHYYDVYQLLGAKRVQDFIGTAPYLEHKTARFPKREDPDLSQNTAFTLDDQETRKLYADRYESLSAFYYRGQPSFDLIVERIQSYAENL